MRWKWFLIFFVVFVSSFMLGILLRGCEQARGAEISLEFRVLANEFNKTGKELTEIRVRVDNIETVFLMGEDVLKDISLTEEERMFCADAVNMDFNKLMVAGKWLKPAVVKMESALNKIRMFKALNPEEEEEIKEKFIALGKDMLGKAREKLEKLEKYDIEFEPF